MKLKGNLDIKVNLLQAHTELVLKERAEWIADIRAGQCLIVSGKLALALNKEQKAKEVVLACRVSALLDLHLHVVHVQWNHRVTCTVDTTRDEGEVQLNFIMSDSLFC